MLGAQVTGDLFLCLGRRGQLRMFAKSGPDILGLVSGPFGYSVDLALMIHSHMTAPITVAQIGGRPQFL